MRFRILVFIVFQIVAWTIFFRSDKSSDENSQRFFKVTEIRGQESSAKIDEISSYNLVLRNDGLFTKLVDNNIVESGLWSVNYDIPSLILKSPSTEYKFKIVQYDDSGLEIMLINQHEIEDFSISGTSKAIDLLFSSSNKDY